MDEEQSTKEQTNFTEEDSLFLSTLRRELVDLNDRVDLFGQSLEDVEYKQDKDVFTSSQVINRNLIIKDKVTVGAKDDVAILSVADSTYRLWIGNATSGSAAFRVTKGGVMTATNAVITGSITATSGSIGGWTIGATTLTGGAVTLDSAGIITGGTIRTSATGERVELTSDELRAYDSSNVLRVYISGTALVIQNSSGTAVGSVQATSTTMAIGAFLTDGNVTMAADGDGTATLAVDSTPYFWASGLLGYNVASKAIVPSADDTHDLGSSGSYFKTLYISEIIADTGSGNGLGSDLLPDTTGSRDLGSSSRQFALIHGQDIYADDLRLNSGGNIYYNGVIAFDFSTSTDEILVGSSGLTDLIPYTNLGVNLGTSSARWNDLHVAGADFYGNLDMNNNDINNGGDISCDGLRLTTGSAHSPAVEGEITFYDSGSIQYRGQIVSTDYSFDLTAA